MTSELNQTPMDSPPPPSVPITKDNQFPGFWQAVLLVLIFLIGTVILAGVAVAATIIIRVDISAEIGSFEPSPVFTIWTTAAINSLMFCGVLLIGKVWSGRPWTELLPLSYPPARLFLLLPALLLFCFGAAIILSEFDNISRFFLPVPGWLRDMMKDLITSGLGSFVVLVVVAPITEEGLFRGVILNGFLKRYSPGKAIILSSVLFSLIHVNPYQMLSAFSSGLMLAWLRNRSNSLWPCICLHAIFNLIAFSAGSLPFAVEGFNAGTSGEHYFQPWWFNGIGLVLVIAGFWLTRKLIPVRVRNS